MSKANNTKAIIFTVALLSFMVVLIASTIVYVYKDPIPTETETSAEQTFESSSETKTLTEKRISVYETSDIHGKLVDISSGDKSTYQYRLAYMAKIFNDARTSGDYADVLLVDGGDIYQGDVVSNLTQGAALRAAMDSMQYDAVTLGSHDFDWDASKYAMDGTATVPSYELGEYNGNPSIPVLASNLYNTTNQRRTLTTKDYVIVEKAGCRIALIGYIPNYASEIAGSKFEMYEIHDDLAEFSKRVKEINAAEHPDATIVVAHCAADEMANALDPNDVLLVMGGRTHKGMTGTADNGIYYMQAESEAQGYAHETLVFKTDGTVKVDYLTYISIMESPEDLYENSANAENFDQNVLAISHAALDKISDTLNEALGYIETSVEREGHISGPTTTAGNFITGLMLEYYKSSGVVAAFHSGGGIGKDLVVAESGMYQLSAADIYAMTNLNYSLMVYELTGQELAQQIAKAYANVEYGGQMSGFTFEYRNNGTDTEPVYEIVSITLSDGTKVDLTDQTTKYKVVITNYCAGLEGSIFSGKKPLKAESEAPVDSDAFISVLRKKVKNGEVHIATDNTPRGTKAV